MMTELNSIFDLLVKYQPAIYLVGFTFFCLIILIDNINITALEKKLMTPKPKFMFYFSQVFLVSLLTVFLGVLLGGKATEKLLNENDIWIVAIVLLCLLLMIMIIFSLLIGGVWLVAITTSINYDYYLIDNDGEWNIIRMNKDKQLLVEKDKLHKFVSDSYTHKYQKTMRISESKEGIYKWLDQHGKFLFGMFIVSIIFLISPVLFSLLAYDINIWVEFILYLIGLFTLLTLTSFKLNIIEYKKNGNTTSN